MGALSVSATPAANNNSTKTSKDAVSEKGQARVDDAYRVWQYLNEFPFYLKDADRDERGHFFHVKTGVPKNYLLYTPSFVVSTEIRMMAEHRRAVAKGPQVIAMPPIAVNPAVYQIVVPVIPLSASLQQQK